MSSQDSSKKYIEFGWRLRTFRTYLRKSQAELARELGYSSNTGLSQVELGQNMAPVRIVEYLNKKYNMNLDWFYTGAGPLTKEPGVDHNEVIHRHAAETEKLENIIKEVDIWEDMIGEIDYEGFPQRLKLALRFLGVTQKAVAKAVEYDYTYINHVIAGRRKPARDLLIRFTLRYPVPIQWLARGEGDYPPSKRIEGPRMNFIQLPFIKNPHEPLWEDLVIAPMEYKPFDPTELDNPEECFMTTSPSTIGPIKRNNYVIVDQSQSDLLAMNHSICAVRIRGLIDIRLVEGIEASLVCHSDDRNEVTHIIDLRKIGHQGHPIIGKVVYYCGEIE